MNELVILDDQPRAVLHDSVAGKLREMIVRGELLPGTHIAEIEFCQRFGVSRTPLREALKVLAAEELIDIRPHRGAIVTEISLREIREAFEISRNLEKMCGPLICDRISNMDIAYLRRIVEHMELQFENRNLLEYFELNSLFHNELIKYGDNQLLCRIYKQLFDKLQRARYRVNHNPKRWAESCADHRAIMDALIRRDGIELGQRLFEHSLLTEKAAIERLGP